MNTAFYKKLRLKAEREEDLHIFSTLLQDAVLKVEDMAFLPKHHRFVLVANRFRWEEDALHATPVHAELGGERIRTALRFEGVLEVKGSKIPFEVKEQVLELLAIKIEETETDFRLTLAFAGGSAIALRAEIIEAYLEDLTTPWPVKSRPTHPGP